MRFLFLVSALSLSLTAHSFEVINDQTQLKVLTPSFSERKTAKIKLDNGLEAYIISDPLLKESGAALSVAVGSWDDPIEYPGMAHFLEHMLFMGTKAYPDEAEYSSFIQSHGGAMNAYTASDKTVYSFSINPPDFDGALDRFSHFFIDPLFSVNSLSRELHNVDQEHAKNVENDGARLYQVFKETSNKTHPNHAFSTGNAETLSGIPQSVMKEFYEKYYSSDRMSLVVMDKAPLDKLISSVKSKFSSVPTSKYQRKLPTSSIFSEAQKGGMLTICPLRETKSLSLVWELESQYVTDFTNKTAEFLSYLIASEAQGQLADTLKQKGYINNLSSSKDKFSKDQGLFSIDIDLSEKGLNHKDEVIQICFNYLSYLAKSFNDPAIFNQWKSIIKTRYQYQDRYDVFEQVTDIAGDLVDENLALYPEQGIIPQNFDENKLLNLISSLRADNCLFVILNQNGHFNKTETWTGAKYSLEPVSSQLLEKYSSSLKNLQFAAIQPNPYAPASFQLLSASECEDLYQKLTDQENFELLYKPTNFYGLPQYSVRLKMTPTVQMKKEDLTAFLNLFVRAFNKKLMFDLDAAAYCGLGASLMQQEGALWMTIDGFNDKSITLLTKIVDNLKNFSITHEEFDLIKQNTKDGLANVSKELGFRQGLLRFSALFDSSSTLPSDVQMALKGWDKERFNHFCHEIKDHLCIEGLIVGNANKEQAETIKHLLSPLVSKKQLPESRIQKVLDLDEQKGPYIYKKNLEVQGSSLILAIQQDRLSPLSRMKTALLMPVLSELFFDTLRTKQHTGYIAKAFDREIAKQQFFLFGVQSNSHGALELLYRFELFIEDFVNNFDERLSNEKFISVKNAISEEIRARKENLPTLASYDMTILTSRDADFSWNEKLLSVLKEISYEDLKEFAFKTLPRTNKKRVAFLMDGKLPENRKLTYHPSTIDHIQNEGQFSLPLYLQPQGESGGYSRKLVHDEP